MGTAEAWLRCGQRALRRHLRAFLALVRDALESVYASYPGEEVEEEFAAALEGEEGQTG